MGRSAIPNYMYMGLPQGVWKSPLKFEESHTWPLIDFLIARTIVFMTYIDEKSEVPFLELVKRVETQTHMKEEYLLEVIPRMLRDPPDDVNGVVKRYRFRS